MVDYNNLLNDQNKIDYLVKQIDAEREKITKILYDKCDNNNQKLAALEEYYLLLKEMTEKYHQSVPKDKSTQEN